MSVRFRAVLWVLLIALVGGLVPAPVTAHDGPPTHEEYEDVRARLERARRLLRDAKAREQGLERRIDQTAAERRAAEIELEELQALVDEAQGRLQEVEGALAAIQKKLDVKTAELKRTLLELQERNDLLEARATRVYMDGPASFFDLLLGARSVRELIGRIGFASAVARADERRIEQIRKMRARVVSERREIAALRDEVATEADHLRAERDRVATLRNRVDARHDELSSALQGQHRSLGQVRSEKEQYLEQQRELERESARIASFLRGRSGGEAKVAPGGMLWPTSGPVTSGFGTRVHPIFGTKRFHSGIDIGAPTGRTVSASAPGEVIFTGAKGGYGNTVMVDHGGGVVTLYAHMSSILAGTGAFVAGGDPVGRVGCTGYCTGPHLHFEVRVNGEPQNPLRWLA